MNFLMVEIFPATALSFKLMRKVLGCTRPMQRDGLALRRKTFVQRSKLIESKAVSAQCLKPVNWFVRMTAASQPSI